MSVVRRHPLLARYASATLVFLLALVLSFHAVLVHPGSRIVCCFSDATSSLRDYWAASVQDRSPFSFTHDALNGAPQGYPRTPATVIALSGLQVSFVWELRHVLGAVGAWNAFLFIGLVATGLAMFTLLDRLGCSLLAALFGAYVFAFSPYALERAYAGHLALLHNWVFVLIVALMLRLRARRTMRRAVAVGGALGIAFFLSAYQGLLGIVTILAFFLAELARVPGRGDRLRTLALAGTSYATSAALLTPLFVLYAGEKRSVELEVSHTTNDAYLFGARLGAYLLPSPRNPLFHWLAHSHPGALTEQSLFFGYSTLILALAAVVLMLRRDPWFASPTRLWTGISMALLALLAVWTSFPPTVRIGSTSVATGSAPLALLTNYWRAYARLGLLAGFAGATLAAFALSAYARRGGRFSGALTPVALAVVFVELLPGNLGAIDTNARPAWVAWLARQPHGIVASYPLVEQAAPEVAMREQDSWYQRFDGDPLFAYTDPSTGWLQSRQQAIRLLAHDLGDPLSAAVLATEGVRYVVVHGDVYRASQLALPAPSRPHFTLLRRFGAIRIYALRARTVNIAAELTRHSAEIARLRGS